MRTLHPCHGCTFSICLCSLSSWLTLPQGVLSTYWCCPSRPCVVFLACMHLALFLALSLSPCNCLVSSWCDHSMLASFWSLSLVIFKDWRRSPNSFKTWSWSPTKNEDSASLVVRLLKSWFIMIYVTSNEFFYILPSVQCCHKLYVLQFTRMCKMEGDFQFLINNWNRSSAVWYTDCRRLLRRCRLLSIYESTEYCGWCSKIKLHDIT